MVELFEQKSEQLFNQVTSDKRWDISNQTLFNVFALSYFHRNFFSNKKRPFLARRRIRKNLVRNSWRKARFGKN
ncbi:hypothetical protein [Pedobacter namyangjuensis]|uniref:hypothetical protein n=1 Tax=Pedobacter namyangjuensis TaxID=600626 RepID=UPI000DE4ADF7|nr:hypothetical protein [Pedobacter namyangjuensis]